VAPGAEHAPRDLGEILFQRIVGDEVDGACGGEVAELDDVGPLEHFDPRHRLRDEEVEIGVALAMRVRAEIHGEAIDGERDVRAVVRVESAEQVLLGLAAPLVLADDQAGHEAEHVGRPAVGAQLEVAPRDQQFGRRRRDRRSGHGDGREHGGQLLRDRLAREHQAEERGDRPGAQEQCHWQTAISHVRSVAGEIPRPRRAAD
jgi:hypothetical protein